MFGSFFSPAVSDPVLGELRRTRGAWRGQVTTLARHPVPLMISGNRRAPDAELLELAHTLPDLYAAGKPDIEQALWAHFQPVADALAAGELPPSEFPLPQIRTPDQVWANVSLDFVAVLTLDGQPTIEFGYRASWDEEHTLGARFRNGRLIELCGSTLPP